MSWLLVALGAAVGAPARYLLDRHLQGRTAATFPWGTLTVNALGSLLLGVLTGFADRPLSLLAGAGFCGAFTTYSTFGYETVRLAETGSRRYAAVNVVANLAAGLAAAAAGTALGVPLARAV